MKPSISTTRLVMAVLSASTTLAAYAPSQSSALVSRQVGSLSLPGLMVSTKTPDVNEHTPSISSVYASVPNANTSIVAVPSLSIQTTKITQTTVSTCSAGETVTNGGTTTILSTPSTTTITITRTTTIARTETSIIATSSTEVNTESVPMSRPSVSTEVGPTASGQSSTTGLQLPSYRTLTVVRLTTSPWLAGQTITQQGGTTVFPMPRNVTILVTSTWIRTFECSSTLSSRASSVSYPTIHSHAYQSSELGAFSPRPSSLSMSKLSPVGNTQSPTAAGQQQSTSSIASPSTSPVDDQTALSPVEATNTSSPPSSAEAAGPSSHGHNQTVTTSAGVSIVAPASPTVSVPYDLPTGSSIARSTGAYSALSGSASSQSSSLSASGLPIGTSAAASDLSSSSTEPAALLASVIAASALATSRPSDAMPYPTAGSSIVPSFATGTGPVPALNSTLSPYLPNRASASASGCRILVSICLIAVAFCIIL